MLSLAFILVAQLSPQAAAWSSARPPECATSDPTRAANVWERAKNPQLRRYCDLLASGASKLAGSAALAADVIAIADEAERTIPGKAAARVLRGRALAQLGRVQDAHIALKEAKEKDERALDDPHALFAWARVLVRTGNMKDAEVAYRALLPRTSMLGLEGRATAAIESGLLSMTRGAPGLDEALPVLRHAVREAQDVAQTIAAIALALALDRGGDREEARALLADRVRGDARPMLGGARAKEILGPLGLAEIHALTAIALEAHDASAAREQWAKAAEAKGPWAEHAKARAAGGKKR